MFYYILILDRFLVTATANCFHQIRRLQIFDICQCNCFEVTIHKHVIIVNLEQLCHDGCNVKESNPVKLKLSRK